MVKSEMASKLDFDLEKNKPFREGTEPLLANENKYPEE